MPYVLRPEDGSQLKYPDMTRISMMPNQKLGIEMPKKPNIEPKLSAHEFGFAPAQTPSGMPKMIAISSEISTTTGIVAMIRRSRYPSIDELERSHWRQGAEGAVRPLRPGAIA